ncbi:MAG: flagellar FliJ family protein [Lentisphaeraceae bacterium]|nr:flagellar FliJ family protein [Lentisphaeraceae bacterium]
MKKFSYSLSSVLKVRKIQEQQARAEVAKVLAERQKMAEEMEQLASEMLASRQRLKSSGVVDISEFRQNEVYLQGIKTKTAKIIEKLKEYDLRLVQLKKELHLKSLETKKLETHHDKEKHLWREEALKEEQAEFDDIANSRRR